ncbi:hypothetical protein [Mesorhizobium sp.]|uniref:hypothetical protein n=1 Tax=Mesorhizobium sp. TaxID=1871066 RepID=UPI000FE895C4|nr:hypothetical protein [Mesorhizobium sp.]RWO22801.1 MAG: hypothetical protein EOS09_19205 [Mesorhizobium sp.]
MTAPNWCVVCGIETTFTHDHRADLTGLDDGPPFRDERKKPEPKSPDEYKRIRSQAWATRRQKYGTHGHR